MTNILVTGANGFIGSHLVNRLKRKHNVVSLVHSTIPGRWIRDALSGTIIAKRDVRDHEAIRTILSRYEIDQVYHTAALSIVKTAYQDPIGVFETNVMGTVSLLEACRQTNVKKILILNTDKVYGEGLDATEDKPYSHSEPYASSKCCQGFVALTFMDTYGMNIVMSHSCNVFGYDPRSNRIIPNVVKACLSGRRPYIFKNDDSIREYIYIEDLLDAFEMLMSEESNRGSRNISTGYVYGQAEIVKMILKHFDLEPEYVEGDIPKQVMKQSLKSARWDWKPSWSFDDAIKATIAQFKEYSDDWMKG